MLLSSYAASMLFFISDVRGVLSFCLNLYLETYRFLMLNCKCRAPVCKHCFSYRSWGLGGWLQALAWPQPRFKTRVKWKITQALFGRGCPLVGAGAGRRLGAGGWGLGAGGWELGVGGWRLEADSGRLAAGSWWLVAGGWWLVAGSWWLVASGW